MLIPYNLIENFQFYSYHCSLNFQHYSGFPVWFSVSHSRSKIWRYNFVKNHKFLFQPSLYHYQYQEVRSCLKMSNPLVQDISDICHLLSPRIRCTWFKFWLFIQGIQSPSKTSYMWQLEHRHTRTLDICETIKQNESKTSYF